MKRITISVAIFVSTAACLSALLCCLIIPTDALAEDGPKVLVIPREGDSRDIELMLKKEVGVMTQILRDEGFVVKVATASGSTIVAPTSKLKPDMRLAEVKKEDYVGFIMPCMAVGAFPGPPVAPEAVAIVKHAVAEGKPLAAQFGSVVILAQAGVLKGKKYAFLDDPLKPTAWRTVTDPRFVDAIYSGRGVVQDGNIITSGICPYLEARMNYPDGTTKLTQAFIDELKKK
jgi:putative intracellular protease/amidase